jgi:glycosyltransferase involved in cell wall biosynthesis
MKTTDNSMPMISIIITNYNYSQYVCRAIRSCLNQSVSELIETIIVDDCSDDNSVDIINDNFSSSDVRKFFLDKNMGVAYCSNLAIKKAKGMYVMRVDADDYIHYKMAEYLLEFVLMNDEYTYAYCDHIKVDKKEKKFERVYLNNDDALLNHGAGILFKKSHLESIGLYEEDMFNCEDMLLLKKLRQNNFNGIYVQLPLYRYFKHDNNMTNDLKNRKKWADEANRRMKSD